MDEASFIRDTLKPADLTDISVKLNEITITKVEHCRYLGIFLDETLTWSHHIDTVYSKLMKYVGIFFIK